MYCVMWSEHCSYKSLKVHLRQFGDLPHSEALLVGIGENAGVVDVGDGYAVTFKVESHNHPSYVEPYQGAATGVGGIVRDILTMGARPIAVMDSPPLRPRRRPRHRPRAARRRRRRRRLRQLPGPAQHRRRAALRRLLRREPAGQRAVRRRHEARGRPAGQGRGRRQQGHPVRRPHRRRRHRRRQRAGQRDLRRARPGQAPERAGRRPVHREAAHRGVPGDLRRRPRHRHPGPRRRRALLRDVRAGQRRHRRHARRPRHRPAARQHAHPGRDPDERVAGAHVRHRRAGQGRRVPRRLPQVGRAGHRHR